MKRRVTKSGFTIIELIVVIGVFSVITSVVLARYRSYGTGAEFVNAVENIVLALREAQVYGTGSKTAAVACGGSAFNCAYGVNFVNSGTSYTIFADTDMDGTYSSGEELPGGMIVLPSGVSLSSVTPTPLNIIFKRPFPDAIINNNPANTSASITVSDSKSGKEQTITISSTGMISVQ